MTLQQQFESGLSHHKAGRLAEAEKIYRQILMQQPNYVDALQLLGVLSGQMGRTDIAVDLIGRAIALNPNVPEAYNNLGNALKENGRLDEAIAAYRRAIALGPNVVEAHIGLANALKAKGELDEAIAAYQRAIALRPNFHEVYNNLGLALSARGRVDEAITAYRRAIALGPNYAEGYSNLGQALKEKGQLDEAIAVHRQAVALRPNMPEVHNNFGIALKEKGQLDEAIAAYRQAIVLRPNYAGAHCNLGNALKDAGQLDEAIGAYRQAFAMKPDYAEAESNLLFALHCHPGYDARAIAEEHRRWDQRYTEPLRKFIQSHNNNRDPERRLRIGYVSPDFRDHVVGQNLLPLFRQHDRGQFEVICYAQVARPDAMTGQLQKHADGWRNIVGLSDEQVAGQIREDRIDILVDLALHTGQNRLLVFARKPAPVQVCYLGYCGSTGMRAMDYRVSDPYLDPIDTDLSCYSEKTVRLPRSYWCYQPGAAASFAPSPLPALQNGFVTFGCLNNFAKVSAGALDLWGRILAAVPNSNLILHAPFGKGREEVVRRLESAGVANPRLHFVGKQTPMEYARTYGRIDVALDPFPYGGGITTCDALWMGVPVVTLSGQTAVGRGGRSILSNVGLTELIAFTPDQYVNIAVELAKDRDRIDALRRGLRARMLASPLMDAAGFARDVEAAYRQMWRGWCAEEGKSGLQSSAP